MRILHPNHYQDEPVNGTTQHVRAIPPTPESLHDDGRVDEIPVVGIGFQRESHEQRLARLQEREDHMGVRSSPQHHRRRVSIIINGGKPMSTNDAVKYLKCSMQVLYHALRRGSSGKLKGFKIEKVKAA